MTDLTMPLSCDEFADRLTDYLEGDLPETSRVAMEAHADVCASCGQLLADIGAVREEAAALPALTPSRDLWTGIADRIDARVLPLDAPHIARTGVRRTWMRPAIAAAALIVVTAGITHVLTRASYQQSVAGIPGSTQQVASQTRAGQRTADSSAPVAPEASTDGQFESSATAPPVTTARPIVRPSERQSVRASDRQTVRPSEAPSHARLASAVPIMKDAEPIYDREIVKLRKIVRERREQLDPRTIAVLEQSIAVIDSAIAQSRAALAQDPASGFLATQLNHSLEKKVELLRTAALLPART
jgi:hypothetical protein